MGVERHFCYSKEKLGDDSSYSVEKAELRDLDISKNCRVSLGGEKKRTIKFINDGSQDDNKWCFDDHYIH